MQIKIRENLEVRVRETYTAYGIDSRRSLTGFLNYLIDKGLDLCDIKRGVSSHDFVEFDRERIYTKTTAGCYAKIIQAIEAEGKKYLHNEPDAVGTKIIQFPVRQLVMGSA